MTLPAASARSIAWLSWHADAFARARTESRPVLLSIAASWSHSCREMDRTSYADPAVQRLIQDCFVPIRVDADRRPDIADRYTLGGLPTTAFLTPEGEVLGGGTFVEAGRFAGALERAASAFATRRGEIDGRRSIPLSAPPPLPPAESRDRLVADVFSTFDREYGGFGAAPKFPLTAPIHLALRLYESSSDFAMREIVDTTLDGWFRGLHDRAAGGFFRCSAARDWSRPQREKLLDVNAALLRVYLDAAETLNDAQYREDAAHLLQYIHEHLADAEDGGWAGSQSDEDWTSKGAADRVLYTGWNGMMVSAALQAARVLNEPAVAEFAARSLERVLLACYGPGRGVAHYFDGAPHVRGLLDDQILLANAALDAFEAGGNITYEMIAEELAYYALRTMWDEVDGGFFDRSQPDANEAVGLLARRVKPFVSNCEAARLLIRVAASSGDHELLTNVRSILQSFAGFASAHGPLGAHYVLAMREAEVR